MEWYYVEFEGVQLQMWMIASGLKRVMQDTPDSKYRSEVRAKSPGPFTVVGEFDDLVSAQIAAEETAP